MVINFDSLIELIKMGAIGLVAAAIIVLVVFIALSVAPNLRQQEANLDRHRQAIRRLENLTKAVRNHGA